MNFDYVEVRVAQSTIECSHRALLVADQTPPESQ